MTSRGILWVDADAERYRHIRLPDNWIRHDALEWGSIAPAMEWVLERYPDASQYGWLADDTVPQTPQWDTKLEAAAGDWKLAYACDLWLSEKPKTLRSLAQGRNLSSGLCWGGNLVRTVGWWALPGVRQAGIDTAWTALVKPLRLYRYVPRVIVEHRNWRTGKRDKDEGDEWTRPDAPDYVDHDLKVRERWVATELAPTRRRVRRAALGRV